VIDYILSYHSALWSIRRSNKDIEKEAFVVSRQLGNYKRSPVKRRQFISLFAGMAITAPVTVHAQEAAKVRVIGMLWGGVSPGTPLARAMNNSFVRALYDLGWTENLNIRIEHRWASPGVDSKKLASELAELQVEIIVVNSSPLLKGAMSATKAVPIVFVRVTDPVGQGFVQSLARPGGNVTGFSHFEPEIAKKWLEIMKEIRPNIECAVALYNPATTPSALMRTIVEAAPSFKISPIEAHISSAGDVDQAMAKAESQPNCCLLVLPDITTIALRDKIIDVVAQHKIPAIYPYGFFVKEGGLISYGIDYINVYRDAASYVNRILKGANVSSLPVQATTKYDLVINMNTAKKLGIDIPIVLLGRADEILE
jgi:putative ABC transport system substrate-binding protein